MELSTLISVGPCFPPIYFRLLLIGTAVCTLINILPYSASAADTMMLRMILHTTRMMLLKVGTKSSGFFGFGGPLLRKFTPLAQILHRDTERYDASE